MLRGGVLHRVGPAIETVGMCNCKLESGRIGARLRYGISDDVLAWEKTGAVSCMRFGSKCEDVPTSASCASTSRLRMPKIYVF